MRLFGVRAGGVALFGPSSAPDEDSPTIEFQVPAGVRRLWDLEEDMPDDYDPNTAQSFVDYNFVADYGFDPLGLSRFDLHLGGAADKERPLQQVLRDYREAELRHGRLAMIGLFSLIAESKVPGSAQIKLPRRVRFGQKLTG